ncbi:RNase adapter RapZ [Pseudomonas aeruginosa]
MRSISVSGARARARAPPLNVLEDNGFYCIDNLPASLLSRPGAARPVAHGATQSQVAVSIDASQSRSSQLQRFPELLQEVRDNQHQPHVRISTPTTRRCSNDFETRRRHPTTDNRSLAEAIGDEPIARTDIADLADLEAGHHQPQPLISCATPSNCAC